MSPARHYKMIACEILYREICFCASRSKNIVDVTFLPKRLHDIGQKGMSARLQEEINKIDPGDYDAILLGYGLCNNGICGLHAPVPLVAARAHDCITLLMGSKQGYADYFQNNPGTYFYSTGWIERDDTKHDEGTIPSQLGINQTYDEYVAKFGEENARYLMDVLGDWLKNYKKLAYIDTHTGDFQAYKEQTQAEAKERNWEYEEIRGSVDLIQRMMDGDWEAKEYLVIPPKATVKASYDDDIIQHTDGLIGGSV